MTQTSDHLSPEVLADLALFGGNHARYAEAKAHVESCAECERELRVALWLTAHTEEGPVPARAPAAQPASMDVRSALLGAAAAVVAIAVAAHDASLVRHVAALGAIGLGALLVATASRSRFAGALSLGVIVAASVGVSLFDLATSSLAIGQPVGCEQLILMAAVLPWGAALWVSRRSAPSSADASGQRYAVAAAGGALMAQAAMLTWCSTDEGWPHVMGFHVLAVVAAGLVGGPLGRVVWWARGRAAASSSASVG